ncbi:hypothetical protein [Azospirillum sp.]|uniref:hypothetical protein n=1 Tax=Azospirillum sp. TaxID=34012 RepID=UPI003D718920
MLTRTLIVCAFSASLAACSGFGSSDTGMAGTYGASGPYAAAPTGSSAPQRVVSVAPLGGIDNGQYPGAWEGAKAGSGSSNGVGDGPPGGIANNQMDRIAQ